MKQPVYLKSFEYSIPVSEKGFHHRNIPYRDYLKMRLPLVKVNIDFVNKRLFLEGNGVLANTLSSKTELTGFDFEKERIKVNAKIYCGLDINLSGSSNEGLVFLLEGVMDDGYSKNPCSGLIVIDARSNRYESEGKEWELRVYLYDSNNDDREVKIDMMMYSISPNAELN
ncbi:MAG TPA: hypothetical protein VNW49_07170 [Puia sp.]|nr:hypothetical protein [Puia sp.]